MSLTRSLARIELKIFKDLSYLNKKIEELEKFDLKNYSVYKVIEMIDNKSIMGNTYELVLLDRKFVIGQYIYYDTFYRSGSGRGQVIIPIKKEIINNKELRQMFIDLEFNYEDLMKLGISEINKNSILKLKGEKEKEQKKRELENRKAIDKNAVKLWKERGIYNGYGCFKIDGKEIKEQSKVVCKADIEFNKVLSFENLFGINQYVDTAYFLIEISRIVKDINLEYLGNNCKIKIEKSKVYIDEVRIPKNKLGVVLRKYGDEIKTKKDLELYVKLNEMKFSLLNQKTIKICDIECNMKVDFIRKGRGVKIKLLGFKKEISWDSAKEVFFYGRNVRTYFYNEEWYSFLKLFNVKKQDFFDELKKALILQNLKVGKER